MAVLVSLIFFFIFSLIFFIFQAFYHHIKINTLSNQADQMINELSMLNRAEAEKEVKKSNLHKKQANYIITSCGYEFSTDELDSKFYLWQKMACEYNSYIILCDSSIPDRVKEFSSFIKNVASYKYDYNLLYILSQTANAPSLLLSCVGIPTNWFSRLVNVACGAIPIYEAVEKIIIPILKSKGLI